MLYEGPRQFKGLVERAYSEVRSFLAKAEPPHILVGSIGKISSSGTDVFIEGDSEAIALFEERYREVIRRGNLGELVMLLESSKTLLNEESTDTQKVAGHYTDHVDLISLNHDKLTTYHLAALIAINFSSIVFDFRYFVAPHVETHELLHRELCDAEPYRTSRALFAATQPSFAKGQGGDVREALLLKHASNYETLAEKARSRGREDIANFYSHEALLERLGLIDLNEVCTSILTDILMPVGKWALGEGAVLRFVEMAQVPPLEEGLTEQLSKGHLSIRGVERLKAEAERLGPQDFVKLILQAQNEAYHERRHVADVFR